MERLGKRGAETALPAASLLILIAVLLTAYVILLPEPEKERLISDPGSVGNTPYTTVPPGAAGKGYGPSFAVALSEVPGLVYPPAGNIVTKPLASLNLFSFTQTGQQSLANVLYVERGTFSEKDAELTLLIRDLRTVETARLLFLVKDSRGDLVVDVNGVQIYKGKADTVELPITIPQSLLRNSNDVRFSVSGTGINLFTKNFFDLKDVQAFITERVENSREARQLVLNEKEVRGMQRMTLYYVVNCFTAREQGRLVILLNGNAVSDGLVVCDAGQVSIDINPAYLVVGTNVLEFAIDGGKYVLEQVLVEEDIGAENTKAYTFPLQVTDIQRLGAGGRVTLDLKFAVDGTKKIGAVYVNGIPVYFNQFEPEFIADITPFVTEGQNFVRVVPDVPVDVAQMTITLY